jgi:tryptophan 2,3-dioxygenase
MDPVTYSSNLALDEILGAQRPRSDEPDEMLFIVIHQVYELWFKQILHELGRLPAHFAGRDSHRAMDTLRRVLTILKVAVAQVDVLETMTPRQFTSFRARLDSSSGFQSAQFRQMEQALADVYPGYLSLLLSAGYEVPEPGTDEMVAVLARVYADDGPEAQVAERLVDLDEGLQEWRYRHVKMVERTIGDKSGTGGSPGVAYLRSTLFRPIYPDLWAVRRLM